MYLNSVLEECIMYNKIKIKHNGFYIIWNIQTDFKHNSVYKYKLDDIIVLHMFYLCQT